VVANQVPRILTGTGCQTAQLTLSDIAGISVTQPLGIYVE